MVLFVGPVDKFPHPVVPKGKKSRWLLLLVPRFKRSICHDYQERKHLSDIEASRDREERQPWLHAQLSLALESKLGNSARRFGECVELCMAVEWASSLCALPPDGWKDHYRHAIFPNFHITSPNFAQAYSCLIHGDQMLLRFDPLTLWERESILPFPLSKVPYELWMTFTQLRQLFRAAAALISSSPSIDAPFGRSWKFWSRNAASDTRSQAPTDPTELRGNRKGYVAVVETRFPQIVVDVCNVWDWLSPLK